MKLITRVLQSPKIGFSQVFRQFSTYTPLPGADDMGKSNSVESYDDVEWMFGDLRENGEISNSFYRKVDRVEKVYSASYGPTGGNGFGSFTNLNAEGRPDPLDDPLASFTTMKDGMDKKLKDASTSNYFQVNDEEIDNDDDFSFRPDVNFEMGMTYDVKDLDLRRPGVQKPIKRYEFETTTGEVLEKADFRNVRFLANFITESGIIIKRSKTRISAKAQRKIAREIKTARAFGLLPFTTMGTKQFVCGEPMKDSEKDFAYETNYRPRNFVDMEGTGQSFTA